MEHGSLSAIDGHPSSGVLLTVLHSSARILRSSHNGKKFAHVIDFCFTLEIVTFRFRGYKVFEDEEEDEAYVWESKGVNLFTTPRQL